MLTQLLYFPITRELMRTGSSLVVKEHAYRLWLGLCIFKLQCLLYFPPDIIPRITAQETNTFGGEMGVTYQMPSTLLLILPMHKKQELVSI